MAYENAANYNLIKSMGGYAVGTILPWSGSEQDIPTGWVPCDGSNYQANLYPLLYRRIGTTYGGIVTANVDVYTGSFSVPDLNGNGIMDVYENHYEWLKLRTSSRPKGEAHEPTTTSVRDAQGSILDQFWSRVPINDDNLTENSGTYSSEMDLDGEIINTSLDTLTARVSEIGLIGGEYQDTAFILGRKLSDKHWRGHTHAVDGYDPSQETNSLKPKDAFMDNCAVVLQPDGICNTTVECTSPLEPNAFEVPGGRSDEYGVEWYLSPVNYREGTGFGYTAPSGSSGIPANVPNFVPGGGGIRSGAQRAGDGYTQGDMWAQAQWDLDFPSGLSWNFSNGSVINSPETRRNFQTSLSNTEVLWSEVVEHDHGIVELEFTSRLRAIESYTWSDIRMGTVSLNNTTGLRAARIDANTFTPTLSMMFIIKAY